MAKSSATVTAPTAKPKGSATGFVLGILSLVLASIGSGLVKADFHSKQHLATTSAKVGDSVAAGTGHVVGSLIAVPFLVVGFALAIIAVILVLARFRKHLKFSGIFFSVISLLLSIWSFSLVIDAFSKLKAH